LAIVGLAVKLFLQFMINIIFLLYICKSKALNNK